MAEIETLPEGIQKNTELKHLNTFGVEAKVQYFFNVTSEQKLQELVRTLFFRDVVKPVRILGGGSNVLITDDLKGLLLWVNLLGKYIESENEKHVWLTVGAGENWHEFVQYAVSQNWGGVENLSLIPGMVGAAPIQNIGAYGVELKEKFAWLRAVNLQTGDIEVFYPEDCDFGYRYSVFKGPLKDQYFVVSVTLQLDKEPVPRLEYKALQGALEAEGVKDPDIKQISDMVCRIRQSKLPDPNQVGNSGSFFKNPVISLSAFEKLKADFPDVPFFDLGGEGIKIPAGWLIEKVGMKGVEWGNTGTWPKQALVIINRGGASGKEIFKFSRHIQQKVQEKFGLWLENEVNIW